MSAFWSHLPTDISHMPLVDQFYSVSTRKRTSPVASQIKVPVASAINLHLIGDIGRRVQRFKSHIFYSKKCNSTLDLSAMDGFFKVVSRESCLSQALYLQFALVSHHESRPLEQGSKGMMQLRGQTRPFPRASRPLVQVAATK